MQTEMLVHDLLGHVWTGQTAALSLIENRLNHINEMKALVCHLISKIAIGDMSDELNNLFQAEILTRREELRFLEEMELTGEALQEYAGMVAKNRILETTRLKNLLTKL